ncbi:unannotated protein [freshwater metagenome]|uniref:Unannotated protein n=1 Tax=freshwater metagenome TaxID=449393 RepID=A0A6J6B9G5_9ZZZZ|nr:hypothetical protein [Actinomycetota bacterium]
MTSNEKTRFTIRNRLADHFDEGFADDLMSLVPPFDVSELATRAEMHAEFGSVRAEMALGFAGVDAEFGSVRAEMALGFAGVDAEFGSVRAEMHAEFGSLRAEMALGFARVDTKFAELRSEMHQNLRNSNMAMMSLMVALHGLLFAALKIWP